MHDETRKTLEDLQDWIDGTRNIEYRKHTEYSHGGVNTLNMLWCEIERRLREGKTEHTEEDK